MEINAIKSQNFGKIFIDNYARQQLQRDILQSHLTASAYKEAISDILEISADPKNIIKINKNGEITSYNLSKGVSHSYSGNNLTKLFIYALKSIRNSEYSSFVNAIKNNIGD